MDLTPMLLDGFEVGSVACWVAFAALFLLLLLLLVLFLYNRHVFGLRPVQHLCEYCGHMVAAVSHCHHAAVRERFLHGVCLQCRGECKLVCSRCKRPL